MKHNLLSKTAFAIFSFLFIGLSLQAQVRITEVMSNSGTGGTADWFELTNLGSSSVDISGWKMDDNSYLLASAVALNGITSIPAYNSVVFIESATPATDTVAFKTFWGNSMNNIRIGTYTGSGVSLSSSGDGVILFNASGTEVTRVAVAAASTGSTFYWTYKSDGTTDATALSVEGTINGSQSNQVSLKSTNTLYNIGSPGTAVIFPLSTAVNQVSSSLDWQWKDGILRFSAVPYTKIEVYSLTGSKVALVNPTEILDLNYLHKGIYFVRYNEKTIKLILK